MRNSLPNTKRTQILQDCAALHEQCYRHSPIGEDFRAIQERLALLTTLPQMTEYFDRNLIDIALSCLSQSYCTGVLRFTPDYDRFKNGLLYHRPATPKERYQYLEDALGQEIDLWHSSVPLCKLHEWLGFTRDEYAEFVIHPQRFLCYLELCCAVELQEWPQGATR